MPALSTYFMNDMEFQLLALPIPPRALLGAKFTAVYVAEALLSLLVMASAMLIFAIKRQPPALFYVAGSLAGLLVPLPVLALVYAAQIPLLSFARFLRNKQAILVVGGLVGIAFAIVFNLYYQGMMANMSDSVWLLRNAGPDSVLAQFGRAWPPAYFAWQAMVAPGLVGFGRNLLPLAAICLGAPLLLIVLLGGRYAQSLVGFNEQFIRKMTAPASSGFLADRLRTGNRFWSLVKREIVGMNREPMYFLNGPFIIVLLPVLMAVMLGVQREALLEGESLQALTGLLANGAGTVVVALAGAFLGSGTSITCTALSRDAKLLPYLKSLPVPAHHWLLAKLVHGLIFAVFGVAMAALIFGFFFRLAPLDLAAGSLVGLALSFLCNLLGLLLDTVNPRLSWDNPIAAMKQNPNAVIIMLGVMGLMGGIAYLSFRFRLTTGQFVLLCGGLPAALFVVLLLALPGWAARRFTALEV